MTERNAETPEGKRILYRIGMNRGDVLIEGDDTVGGGVNNPSAARRYLRARGH